MVRYSSNKVINELKRDSAKMYDPSVEEAFLKIIQAEDKDVSLSPYESYTFCVKEKADSERYLCEFIRILPRK
jgi:HD-GYP domain-containing protein (c-di-GMP phosphodiesterase class II)